LFDDLPDHVTLQRFESWVCQNCKRAFFDEVLRQIDADYPDDKLQIQIGDTYAMHANASRENLIPLLRHSSEQVLRSAVQTIPVQEPCATLPGPICSGGIKRPRFST
jgi:hypothetical protein